VHSFEPNPFLWPIIESRIAANKKEGRIVLHKVGLSNTSGLSTFFLPNGANQGTGTFDLSVLRVGETVDLDLRHGDQFLAEARIKPVDFVKIDVEGLEYEVIHGLAATIERDRPIIWVEVSQQDLTRRLSKATLACFSAYRAMASERAFLLLNIERHRETDEISRYGHIDVFLIPRV
jgi:FkbM family methyltransferase